jgi:hypothetical protein
MMIAQNLTNFTDAAGDDAREQADPPGLQGLLPDRQAADYGQFMVLSLGTGSAKSEEKFDAVESSKWGLLGWL